MFHQAGGDKLHLDACWPIRALPGESFAGKCGIRALWERKFRRSTKPTGRECTAAEPHLETATTAGPQESFGMDL